MLQITGIIFAVVFLASVIFVDESYPPALLIRKANKLRHETINWALHSKYQETGSNFRDMARKYLIVPFEMSVDPICFFINLYSSFCYAIVYLYAMHCVTYTCILF